jgi:hypothetical protein
MQVGSFSWKFYKKILSIFCNTTLEESGSAEKDKKWAIIKV